MKNIDPEMSRNNLIQVEILATKYSNITSVCLNEDKLNLRSYPVNSRKIGTQTWQPDKGLQGLYERYTQQICINSRVSKNAEATVKLVELSQKQGFSTMTDRGTQINYTITHEFGHFIENCIIEKNLQNDVHRLSKFKTLTRETQEIEKEEAEKIRKNIEGIAKTKYKANEENLIPSKYGKDNPFEWFAETFTESQLHTTDKPLVKAMRDFLEEVNKK